MCIVFDGKEPVQVTTHRRTAGSDLAQQRKSLSVILAARAEPERGATCRIRCSDSREHRERRHNTGRRQLLLFYPNQLGYLKERTSLDPPRTRLL